MMNVFFKLLASVLLSASVSFAGTAKDPLESQLKSFHANPKNFYMRHIPKYDLQGRRVKSNVLGTRKQSAVTRKKLQYRSKYFNFEKKARTFTAPPGENDKANVIVDGGNPIDNIFEIESRG